MPKKFTKEDFVAIANEVHNGKYNYENSVYINSMSYIVINCPEHGDFKQRANAHIRGHKCPKCGRFTMATKKRNGCSFIEAATKKHGNKYDYSKVVYENNRSKVIIGCPIHGDFIQTASDHQQGNGCHQCGKEKNRLGTTKHGFSGRELYSTWYGMMRRCFTTHAQNYDNYGGRGITVSEELKDYETFEKYAISLPRFNKRKELGLTLNRIDNDGNYERDNLEWATQAEQNDNKRYWNATKYDGIRVMGDKFKAGIFVSIGCFNTEEEAVNARNEYIKKNNLPDKIQTFSS